MTEGLHPGESLPKVRLDIRKEDIRPEIPEVGGTVLILQRNAKDDRSNPESPDFGALVPEAAKEAEKLAEDFYDKIYSELSDEEKQNLYTLVFASDVSLTMPTETNSPHRRAFETAEEEIKGIESSMSKNGVEPDRLLNNQRAEGSPIGVKELLDLEMFQSPEFMQYMKERYGTGKDFWIAYEEDVESDTRLDMGAEGPSEIAIRMRKALTDLTQDIAKGFHVQSPDARLIIWAVSHYDSVSPFIKGYVYQADPAKLYVPVEQAGGITVKIGRDNKTAETTISGQRFEVPALLHKPGIPLETI